MRTLPSQKMGFTIMEVMTVIIILGLIAGYALPNYNRAIRKARERDAITQLALINGANEYFRSRNGTYLQGTGDVAFINANLNLSIASEDLDFDYQGDAPVDILVTYTGGVGDAFDISYTKADIVAEPVICCNSAGTCPSLPDC